MKNSLKKQLVLGIVGSNLIFACGMFEKKDDGMASPPAKKPKRSKHKIHPMMEI